MCMSVARPQSFDAVAGIEPAILSRCDRQSISFTATVISSIPGKSAPVSDYDISVYSLYGYLANLEISIFINSFSTSSIRNCSVLRYSLSASFLSSLPTRDRLQIRRPSRTIRFNTSALSYSQLSFMLSLSLSAYWVSHFHYRLIVSINLYLTYRDCTLHVPRRWWRVTDSNRRYRLRAL